MSSVGRPFIFALEVEADLVEWVVNKEVSNPANPKIALIQPATEDFWISWCDSVLLKSNCFLIFLSFHFCDSCR